MKNGRCSFRDWWIISAVTMIIGGSTSLYSLLVGQVGAAISMSGLFWAGLTMAVGGHYLKRRIDFVRSVITAANGLRTNPQASDAELTAKIRETVPDAKDESCAAAVDKAKQYLSRPETLEPWMRKDFERWDITP